MIKTIIKPDFLKDIELTEADTLRLTWVISNWKGLNAAFKSGVLIDLEIDKMILIELNGKQRPHTLNKLIQRRNSSRRKSELEEIKTLISKKEDGETVDGEKRE